MICGRRWRLALEWMTRYTDMHDRAGCSRRLHYGLSLTTLALGAALGLGDADPHSQPYHSTALGKVTVER